MTEFILQWIPMTHVLHCPQIEQPSDLWKANLTDEDVWQLLENCRLKKKVFLRNTSSKNILKKDKRHSPTFYHDSIYLSLMGFCNLHLKITTSFKNEKGTIALQYSSVVS